MRKGMGARAGGGHAAGRDIRYANTQIKISGGNVHFHVRVVPESAEALALLPAQRRHLAALARQVASTAKKNPRKVRIDLLRFASAQSIEKIGVNRYADCVGYLERQLNDARAVSECKRLVARILSLGDEGRRKAEQFALRNFGTELLRTLDKKQLLAVLRESKRVAHVAAQDEIEREREARLLAMLEGRLAWHGREIAWRGWFSAALAGAVGGLVGFLAARWFW